MRREEPTGSSLQTRFSVMVSDNKNTKSETVWRIKLYPKGCDGEHSNYVSIFINQVTGPTGTYSKIYKIQKSSRLETDFLALLYPQFGSSMPFPSWAARTLIEHRTFIILAVDLFSLSSISDHHLEAGKKLVQLTSLLSLKLIS